MLTKPTAVVARRATKEIRNRLDKLDKDIQSKTKDRTVLSNTTEKKLWIRDLDEFEKAYAKWLTVVEKKVIKSKK